MASAMSFDLLLLTLSVAAAVAYGLKAISARDTALAAAEASCREAGLQLLDRSVALDRIRLRRRNDGHLTLYRRYGFEFTSDGSRRYRGRVELLGRRVVGVDLEPHRVPPPGSGTWAE